MRCGTVVHTLLDLDRPLTVLHSCAPGSTAAILLNTGDGPATISCAVADLQAKGTVST